MGTVQGILQNRKAQKLLTANFISAIGSGISGVGVSWLLVTKNDGERIFGFATLGVTIILFFLTPYIGVIIDRYSRKKTFLLINLITAGVILAIVTGSTLTGHFTTSGLLILFLTSSLYHNFYFPTVMAFSQEIFDRSLFKKLNGMLEVQNQAAVVTAGGLAGVILGMVSYTYIFLFDAFTFLISFAMIFSIRYESSIPVIQIGPSRLKSFFAHVHEGFSYLKGKPLLVIFLLCSLFPFLIIMATNYLTPVFISHTLGAKANVFGVSEMTYAIGAVAAGIVIPLVLNRLGDYRSMLVAVGVFLVGTFVIPFFPSVSVFVVANMVLGFGNAGTRIVRTTIMMELIPNRIIGRVNSFFQSIGLLIRILIIGTFTMTITTIGALTAWWVLFVLMCTTALGILLSKKAVGLEVVRTSLMNNKLKL